MHPVWRALQRILLVLMSSSPQLLEMLPEMVAEGRKILLFSQFTTMLGLIAAELDKAKIGWVALTGDTRDRRIPVEDFQKGRVPVFLISDRTTASSIPLLVMQHADDFIWLPDLGIRDNGHMLMIENNSHEIAQVLFDWLHGQGF